MASSDISSDGEHDLKTLEYRIYKCSSYSPTYVPENILVDKPWDQSSRWSSDNDNHPQYLSLKLKQPSIVKAITFGKFEKTHVCNIKKFKIYGGMEYDKLTELLKAGLKNDSSPETFKIKHQIGCDNNIYYPIRYIKIMPLQSWGPSFNFSIWHVLLIGIDNPMIIQPCLNNVNDYFKNEIIRLCIKHFRRLEETDVVQSLERVSHIKFEDESFKLLYNILVKNGNYEQTEYFMTDAISNGLLDSYISKQPYKAMWTKIINDEPKPGKRGGHQMVLDLSGEKLYLFGGWDGHQDLADLWLYDIVNKKWKLICQNTERVGGPSARSCHKMTLDQDRKQIFTIGKYLDTQCRTVDHLKSDFYVYDIEANTWLLITDDTHAVGGPKLIFDHQMSMDIDNRMIYVFGGRVLLPSIVGDHNNVSINSAEPVFSGLYSYHVPTSTWNILASDISRPSTLNIPTVKARVGHSMLFNPNDRKLYISPGQRCKEYLNDYFTYEVDTNVIERICLADFGGSGGGKGLTNSPGAGYTQRATIDPILGEIYVLSGPGKDKDKRDDNVQNSFWVYEVELNKWNCIYRNDNVGEKYWNKMQDVEPCPRFAHQLVYDKIKKIHYLFGGNPGRSSLPKLRLDDFWSLKLRRPSYEQLLNKFKWIIRKYKFKELAMKDSIEALEYLQKDVYEIIDHDDEIQTREFQLLTSILFDVRNSCTTGDSCGSVNQSLNNCDSQVHNRRVELYDELMEFFPESLTQPRANLTDLLLL